MPRPRLLAGRAPTARRAGLLAMTALLLAVGSIAVLRAFLWSEGVPDLRSAPVDAFFDADELAPNRRYREGLWAFAVALAPVPAAVAVAVALAGRRWRGRLLAAAGGHAWAAGALFGAALALLTALVTFPLRVGRFAWGRAEGPIVQPFGSWLVDVGKATALQMLIMAAVGVVVIVIVFKLGRAWAPALGVLAALLVVVSVIATPLVAELFMRTEPLRDPELRGQVLELAERAGVEADDVRVNDASARTTSPNAFVAGLGGGRRIVLFDTLVRDFPPDQIRAVTAHELAHVERRHITKGTVWAVVLMVPAVLFIAAVVGWRTGFEAPEAGPAGRDLALRRLAIIAATATALGLVATPLVNWVSRAYEAEADWITLQLTEDPDAAIALRQESVARSVSVPDPPTAIHLWFGTHPTAAQRIALAETVRRDLAP